MSETLLQLKNVSVHYGGVHAVDGVDITIDEGEILARPERGREINGAQGYFRACPTPAYRFDVMARKTTCAQSAPYGGYGYCICAARQARVFASYG